MKFSKEELEIIGNALMGRETRMLHDADLYRDQRNLEAQKDCLDEWRKAHNLHERIRKEIWHAGYQDKQDEMLETVKQFGEDEGDCGHRIWLGDLNGKCDIDGHTDIMSVVASKNYLGQDTLSFQVNTPDDKKTIFVDIFYFQPEVVEAIYTQVMNNKK